MQEIGGRKKKNDKLARLFAFSIMAALVLLIVFVNKENDAIAAALYKSFAGSGAAPKPVTIDSGGDVGSYSSITQGADGFPVISYYDANTTHLDFAKCADSACASVATSTIDSTNNVGLYSSIAIGRDGYPVISYLSDGLGALKFYKCNNIACSSGTASTLDLPGDYVGPYTSIAIGRDGFPVISYQDSTANALKFYKCNDAACSSGAASTLDNSATVGFYTSIAIGRDGFPVISYYDSGNGNLKFVKCNNASCSARTVSTLDSVGDVGSYTSIAIGFDGFPVISYEGGGTDNLKLAKCNDASCSAPAISTLDSASFVGFYTSIAIGRDGLPVISYSSFSSGFLKFVKCNNTSCSAPTILTLDNSGNTSQYTSMAIGTDGYPMISYYDNTNHDLKFLHCNGYCGAVTHVNHSQNSVLTKGLVGLWSFNGPDMSWTQNKAFDRSGNGNDGTLSGSYSFSSGKVGQSLLLASTGKMTASNSGTDLNTTLTIAFWVKDNRTTTSFASIIGKLNGGTSGWQVQRNNGTGITLRVDTSGGTNQTLFSSQITNILEGNWHYVVFILDNGSASAYRDGTLAGTTTYTHGTGFSAPTANFLVGNGGNFLGWQDEIRLYNRALSASEIQQLYVAGSATINASQNNKNTSGLVGQWSFNGPDMNWTANKALDRSGNGNDGVLTNMATSTAPTIGKIGQALKFDGVNDYVNMGAPSALNLTGPFSISAWINPKSFGGSSRGRIVDKVSDDGTTGYALFVDNLNTTNGITICTGVCASGSTAVVSNSNAIQTNTWQQVIVSYNGTTATLYANGVSVGSGALDPPPSGSNNFYIGNRPAGDRAFDGKLDEVRVYNRILPASEIKQLYNQGR